MSRFNIGWTYLWSSEIVLSFFVCNFLFLLDSFLLLQHAYMQIIYVCVCITVDLVKAAGIEINYFLFLLIFFLVKCVFSVTSI